MCGNCMMFICEIVFILETGMLKYLKITCIMSAAFFQVAFLKGNKTGFVCICACKCMGIYMCMDAYVCIQTHGVIRW